MSEMKEPGRVEVFVFLGYDFGANTWRRKQALGLIPGLNDQLAYGYYRAAGQRRSIAYSHDHHEGPLTRFARLALRKSPWIRLSSRMSQSPSTAAGRHRLDPH